MWSTEKVRVRWSDGEVDEGGRNDCEPAAGADGGAGYDKGCSEPRASCMEGNDCRAGGRCGSFSSPEVRRDSGGESKPPSGPGSALALDDW